MQQEQENGYFLEEKRKATDQVLTEKPPVPLEQQQKNWADQGLGEKKGGNQRRAEEKEKEREKRKRDKGMRRRGKEEKRRIAGGERKRTREW